jgi:hypothetical protein
MNDKEMSRTQLLAVFLILSAAICIAIAEHFSWRDLSNFSLTFGGAGVGILTGERKTQNQNTEGGDIVNPPSSTPPPP